MGKGSKRNRPSGPPSAASSSSDVEEDTNSGNFDGSERPSSSEPASSPMLTSTSSSASLDTSPGTADTIRHLQHAVAKLEKKLVKAERRGKRKRRGMDAVPPPEPTPPRLDYEHDWQMPTVATTDGSNKPNVMPHNLPRLSVAASFPSRPDGKVKIYDSPLAFISALERHLRVSNIRESSWHKFIPTLVDDAYAERVQALAAVTRTWATFKRGFIGLFGRKSSAQVELLLRRKWNPQSTMDCHTVSFLTTLEEADIDASDNSPLSAHYRDAFSSSLSGWPALHGQIVLHQALDTSTSVRDLASLAVKLAVTLPMPTTVPPPFVGRSVQFKESRPAAAPKRPREKPSLACGYCKSKFPEAPSTRFNHAEADCRTKRSDQSAAERASASTDRKKDGCFTCGLPGHMARDCGRKLPSGPVKPETPCAASFHPRDALPSASMTSTVQVDDSTFDPLSAATSFINSLEAVLPPLPDGIAHHSLPADSDEPCLDAGVAPEDRHVDDTEPVLDSGGATCDTTPQARSAAGPRFDTGGSHVSNASAQTDFFPTETVMLQSPPNWADFTIPEAVIGHNHDTAAEILLINELLAGSPIGKSATTRERDPVTGRELRPPILAKMLVGSAWATVQIDNGADISILSEEYAAAMAFPTSSSQRFARGYGRNKSPERLAATVPEIMLQHGATVVSSRMYVGPLHNGVDLLLGRDLLHEFGIGTFGTSTTDSAAHIADELAMDNLAKKSSIAAVSAGDKERNNLLSAQLERHISFNKAIDPSSHIEHESATTSIPTDGVPFFKRSYPVKEATRLGTNGVIDDWERTGVIFRRTTPTPYGSPLVIVPKRDSSGKLTGKLRVCIDARQINAHYPKDAHVDGLSSPRIDDILDFASGNKFLSTLDVSQAFLQVMLDESSRELTTFTWNSVEYSFNRLPFGTKHASSTCQRVMASILMGLEDICQIYCDDIVVRGGGSLEEHGERVRLVLDRLNKHMVRLSWGKCHLGLSKAILLGHEVSEHGIGPNMTRCTAWLDAPEPTTVREVVSLIGFAGFYRRNIPAFSKYEAALGRVRLGRPRTPVQLTPDEGAAWKGLVAAVNSAPLVNGYDSANGPIEIYTDASVTGLGAVAVQRAPDGTLHTLGFASRVLQGAEARWSINKLETAALVFGLRRFEHYINGSSTIVYTDNRALSYLQSTKNLNRHAASWFSTVSEHDIDIRHLPGAVNIIADALSRTSPIPSSFPEEGGRDSATLYSNVTETDPAKSDTRTIDTISSFIGSISASDAPPSSPTDDFIIDISPDADTDGSGLDNRLTSTGTQTLSPDDKPLSDPGESKRHDEVIKAHGLIHGGLRATLDELRARGFNWRGISSESLAVVQNCDVCVRNNIRARGYHEPKGRTPLRPGAEYTMDLFDMPGNMGYNAALVMVDNFSRFTVIEPILDKRAETVAAAQWRVFSRIGIPDLVGSDQGPEFACELAKSFASLLGHQHYYVVPRAPESNGMAEAAVARVRRVLKKLCEKDDQGLIGLSWPAMVTQAEFGINRAIHQSTGYRPVEVFLGRPLAKVKATGDSSPEPPPRTSPADSEDGLSAAQVARVRAAVDLVLPELQADLAARAGVAKDRFKRTHRILEPLSAGDVVVVERERITNTKSYYLGPYTVKNVTRHGNYVLENQLGRELARRFHVARLRLVRRRPAADPDASAEFEVDHIVRHLPADKAGGPTRFVVRWKGCEADEDSIIAASSATNCASEVADYWRRLDAGLVSSVPASTD